MTHLLPAALGRSWTPQERSGGGDGGRVGLAHDEDEVTFAAASGSFLYGVELEGGEDGEVDPASLFGERPGCASGN